MSNKDIENTKVKSKTQLIQRILKIMVGMLGLLFVCLVGLYFLIQVPSFQQWGIQKATAYFQKQWNSTVQIESFRLSFTDFLILEGVLVEDRNGMTLLKAGEIRTGFDKNLLNIFRNRLSLNNIYLKDINLNITKEEGVFNFSHIVNYFNSDRKKREASDFDLDIRGIRMEAIQFSYSESSQPFILHANVLQVNIDFDTVNVNQLDFKLEKLEIFKPKVNIEVNSFADQNQLLVPPTTTSIGEIAEIMEEIDSTAAKNIRLLLTSKLLQIEGGSLKYSNYRRGPISSMPPNSIDFDFLDLTGIFLHLEDASYIDFDLQAVICGLQLKSDAGFSINQMEASTFSMNHSDLVFKDLKIVTPHSNVGDQISFSYNSLKDFNDFENQVFMDARLLQSTFAATDLFYFAPQLRSNTFFKKNINEKILLSGLVKGRVNSLRGDNMTMSLAGKISYEGNFRSRNLTEPDETILNLDIENLNTSVVNLKQLLPGFNLPAHFDRLGNINFKGKFDGFYQDFVTFGEISTEMGKATTDIQLNTLKGMKNARYRGALSLKNFQLGRWLQNEDLGLLTMDAQVNNGKGLVLENIEANLAAQIKRFEYKGYPYSNLDFKGKLIKNFMDGAVVIHDENIDLQFDGSIDFTHEHPIFDFHSTIRLLDLYELKFVEKPLFIAGDFDIEIEYKSLSEIEGTADLKDIVISVETGDFLYIDHINIESRFKGSDKKLFRLQSELLDIQLNGDYKLESLYPTINNILVSRHPTLTNALGLKLAVGKDVPSSFDFNVRIHKTKNFNTLLNLPVETFDDLRLIGNFAYTDSLNFKYRVSQLSIPSFKTGAFSLDSVMIFLEGSESGNLAIVHVDKFKSGAIEVVPIDGLIELKNDTLSFNLGTEQFIKSLTHMGINGRMFVVEDRLHVSFDNLEFDALDTRWKIAEKNFIQYKKDFLYARNIRFTNGVGFVSLSTDSEKAAQISGNDIDIALFNQLLTPYNIELEGIASFQFSIDDYFELSNLKGSGFIKDFEFNDIKLGNARVIAIQDDLQSSTLLELTIGEEGKDLKGRGYIKHLGIDLAEGEFRYSFDFFMNRFPLKPAEFFLDGLISQTKGAFSGDFFIEGDSLIRNLGGELTLLDASTKIDYLGTTYFVKNSKAKITRNYIDLNDVELEDINQNKAQVRGGIHHSMFNDLNTDFRISSPAFTVLNTRKQDNDLFYGKALGRIDARFNGPFNAMDLYVNATTGPNTVVAIPLTTAKEVKEQNFIIFISKNEEEPAATISKSSGGLALQMDLTITPEAQLQLIFDERTGDIVKGSGNGNIQLDLARSGEFQMFGEFLIDRGEYPFRVALLDKAFNVKEGGTIVWYGDPLNAYIELEAEYKGLRTSPYNLISEYLRDEDIREQARRATDVDLTLKLQGQLLQPDIQFDIQFPQLAGELRNYTDNKLRTLASDQNEINNIAFQLLFFKSFIPNQSDILSTQGGLGIASSTLTEWFTNQMRVFVNEYLIDTISNKAISDVDLDFGIVLNTDYSQSLEGLVAAGQSQFYLRPRVQMFDDRVIFDFGINNYGRLGADNRLAGEFNVEYAFGDSRRFRTKIYSQDQPLPVNGRRTVFGAGLVYRREYNEFKDIFRSPSKRKNTASKQKGSDTTLPDLPPSSPLPEEVEPPRIEGD